MCTSTTGVIVITVTIYSHVFNVSAKDKRDFCNLVSNSKTSRNDPLLEYQYIFEDAKSFRLI